MRCCEPGAGSSGSGRRSSARACRRCCRRTRRRRAARRPIPGSIALGDRRRRLDRRSSTVRSRCAPARPTRFRRRSGRVGEDPEEDRRVGGQLAFEPVGARPNASATPRMTVWPSAVMVSRYSSTVARNAAGRRGNRFGPCSGNAGADASIVGAELGAEVQPFLAVGYPRGQLAAERKPAPPGAPAVGHRDLGLLRIVEREELARECVEALPQSRIDSVTDDGEEARCRGTRRRSRSPRRCHSRRRPARRYRRAVRAPRLFTRRSPSSN